MGASNNAFLRTAAGAWVVPALLLFLTPNAFAQRSLTVAPVQLQLPGERPLKLYNESYALVIGASNYTNGWPKLEGVPSDVRTVSAALKEQGFKVTEVKDPTLAQLEMSFRKFIGDFGQNAENRLIVYYAGHGHTLKTSYSGQLGYIVPVDAPAPNARNLGSFKAMAMSMETIENYAKQIEAKHVLFVFDSCFSGTFFKMRAVSESISMKTAQPVRQFITAGSADQPVPDVSVFRKQFIAAIKGEGDLNGDGYVTASELGMFLEDKVTNYSNGTQTPQYGKIRDPNLDKGDFVFALAKSETRIDSPPVSAPASVLDPATAFELAFWDSVKNSTKVADFNAYLARYPNGQFAALAKNRKDELEGVSRVLDEERRRAEDERRRAEDERRRAEEDKTRKEQEQARREEERRLARLDEDRRAEEAAREQAEANRQRQEQLRLQKEQRAREAARQQEENKKRRAGVVVPTF